MTIPIDSELIPEGLDGGKFRLMFVTGIRAATAEYMYDYYVRLVDSLLDAGVLALINTQLTHIRTLASTADVDARDNTFTTYTSTNKGVPIFWYKGAIVANDHEDFYDGTWQNEDKPRLYDGTLETVLTKEYWTGSDNDGTAKTRGGVSKALGQSEVETGILNHATGNPLSHAAADPTELKSMYGLTGIYVIEDHPATGLPVITGVPRVGETLTADTSGVSDPNGTDNAVFTYRWSRTDPSDPANSFPISGATEATYTPTDNVAGQKILLSVNMTDNHGHVTFFNLQDIVPTVSIQPTDLIVKNTETGTPSGLALLSNSQQAQGFTAANQAEPYSLTEVRISFAAVDNPVAASSEITVTLNAASSGFPGEALCTLSNPSTIAAATMASFEAPDSCPALLPGATYYIVLTRAGGTIQANVTATQGQHPGSAPGWTLDSGLTGSVTPPPLIRGAVPKHGHRTLAPSGSPVVPPDVWPCATPAADTGSRSILRQRPRTAGRSAAWNR